MNASPLGDLRRRFPASRFEASLAGGLTGVGSAAVLAALKAPFWAAVFPVLAGSGVFALFTVLTPRAVVLRDEGLEVERWLLAARSLRFDAVVGAYWEFATRTSLFGTFILDSAIRLVDTSGRSVRLDPRAFRSAEELFTRIGRLCVWPGHQQRLADFRRGEEVGFGEVSVSQTALRFKGFTVTWAELKRVELSPVQLIFHFTGARWRRTLRLARLPWAFSLVQVLVEQQVPLTAFDGFVLTKGEGR